MHVGQIRDYDLHVIALRALPLLYYLPGKVIACVLGMSTHVVDTVMSDFW